MLTRKHLLIISLVGLSIIGLLIILAYSNRETSSDTQPQNRQHLSDSSDYFIGAESDIYITVIDSSTKTPIEGAVVYLGTGERRCYTSAKGGCGIKAPKGSFSLGAFKKGYKRATKSVNVNEEDSFFTFQLEVLPVMPASVSLEGIIIETILAPGTRSEAHYYKLRTETGEEIYLFEETGFNKIPEVFIDKEVRISGFRGTGFIGWRHEEAEGIYVEKIELL